MPAKTVFSNRETGLIFFHGHERAGFEASGKINSHDADMGWNIPAAGVFVIGDEIKLHFDILMMTG